MHTKRGFGLLFFFAAIIYSIGNQFRICNVGDSLLFLMPHEAGCIPCVRTLYRQRERDQRLLTGSEAAAAANGGMIMRLFSFHHFDDVGPKRRTTCECRARRTYLCTVIRPVVKRDGAVNDPPGGDASWNDDLARLAPCVFPSCMRAHAGHSREPINRFLNLCMVTLVTSHTVSFLARDPVMFGHNCRALLGRTRRPRERRLLSTHRRAEEGAGAFEVGCDCSWRRVTMIGREA
ncbi:putative ATP-dependent DEAD/H RNA helicase [Trypanosoma cruzi]|uniref:Putative ATP-dependent DEAD/H RNA helicase n=1 Tax=Trypanosoma cruzi TaxID=5693 RepID=A0A2V2XHS6_TRYCR|nr:putative ATP-dependent DEAD/H RNA helicase [Trypanosoma cruzi]